jgi:hypothetical protein
MTKTLLENSHRLSAVLTDEVTTAYQSLVEAVEASCAGQTFDETERIVSALLDQLWEATEVITDRLPGNGQGLKPRSHRWV